MNDTQPTPPWARQDEARYTPPKPANPWTILGWIFLTLVILGLIGAVVAGHHSTPQVTNVTCPYGYFWAPLQGQCEPQ
jgi:hypothetical protein